MTTPERDIDAGAPGMTGAELVRAGTPPAAFASSSWMVIVYVLLIVLCVVFAPDRPLKFIYTEF